MIIRSAAYPRQVQRFPIRADIDDAERTHDIGKPFVRKGVAPKRKKRQMKIAVFSPVFKRFTLLRLTLIYIQQFFQPCDPLARYGIQIPFKISAFQYDAVIEHLGNRLFGNGHHFVTESRYAF